MELFNCQIFILLIVFGSDKNINFFEKYINLCYHIYNFIRKVYSRMKRIIALLLVLVMAVTAMAACAKDEGEIMGADEKYSADDIVMKTENFSYTRGEFSVIFYLYVNEFFSSQEAVDFYNIDVNTSFKDQIYYQDTTWFDYFKDISVSYMETVLVRCEGAKAAGIENVEAGTENSPDKTGQSVVWLRPVCVQRKYLLFTQIERGNEALRTTKSQNRGV